MIKVDKKCHYNVVKCGQDKWIEICDEHTERVVKIIHLEKKRRVNCWLSQPETRWQWPTQNALIIDTIMLIVHGLPRDVTTLKSTVLFFYCAHQLRLLCSRARHSTLTSTQSPSVICRLIFCTQEKYVCTKKCLMAFQKKKIFNIFFNLLSAMEVENIWRADETVGSYRCRKMNGLWNYSAPHVWAKMMVAALLLWLSRSLHLIILHSFFSLLVYMPFVSF